MRRPTLSQLNQLSVILSHGTLEERKQRFYQLLSEAIDKGCAQTVKMLITNFRCQKDMDAEIFQWLDKHNCTLLGRVNAICENKNKLSVDQVQPYQDILIQIFAVGQTTLLATVSQGERPLPIYLHPIAAFQLRQAAVLAAKENSLENCQHSIYHLEIQRKAQRLKHYSPLIASGVFVLESFDMLHLTNWFLLSVFHEQHMPVVKKGRKAVNILAEYMNSLQYENTSRYKDWVTSLKKTIDIHYQFPVTEHELVQLFIETRQPAVCNLQDDPPQHSTQKKKKNKKKNKKNANSNQASQITTRIENNGDQNADLVEPEVYQTPVNSALLYLIVEEMFSSKNTLKAYGHLFEIAQLLSVDEDDTYLLIANKLKQALKTPKMLPQENYVLEMTEAEKLSCWQYAVRRFFACQDSEMKSLNAKSFFIQAVAHCVLFDLKQINILMELQANLSNIITQHYPDHVLWLVGSLATRFVQQAFMRDMTKIKVTSDIDLALILEPNEGENNSKRLWVEKFNTLLSNIGARQTNYYGAKGKQTHLATLQFDYQGVKVDLIVYPNLAARPDPVENYKGFAISLADATLQSKPEFLFQLLQGQCSFESQALQQPNQLAFVLRELARLHNERIELSESFVEEFTQFKKQSANKAIIHEAVGLLLTKYIEKFACDEYRYFISAELYHYLPILEFVCKDKTALTFIKWFTKTSQQYLPNYSGFNYFPVLFISAAYLYRRRENIGEHVAEIDKLNMPLSIVHGVKTIIFIFNCRLNNETFMLDSGWQKIYVDLCAQMQIILARQHPEFFKGKLSAWLPQTLYQQSSPRQDEAAVQLLHMPRH